MTRDGEGQDEQRSRSALVRLLVWFIVLFLGVVLGVAVAQWRQWDFDYGRFQTLGRGQLEDERLRQEILKLQRERSLWRNLATNATILIGALGFVVTGFKYIDERQRQRIEDTRQQEADRDQREKDRLTERHRLAALYVNPFLFACEDLQSRLYNILCGGGLGVLRQQYRNGRHAVELIYLIARYFAYEELLIRYSPYGVDGKYLVAFEAFETHFPPATLDMMSGGSSVPNRTHSVGTFGPDGRVSTVTSRTLFLFGNLRRALETLPNKMSGSGRPAIRWRSSKTSQR